MGNKKFQEDLFCEKLIEDEEAKMEVGTCSRLNKILISLNKNTNTIKTLMWSYQQLQIEAYNGQI